MTRSNKRYCYSSVGAKPDTQGDYYNFVFSSDLQDWQVGYKLN